MANLWEIEGFLEERDGILHIDGRPAPEIVAKHGSPVFVFSRNRIKSNINRLVKIQEVINCKLKVCYAAKANSEADILSAVHESGIDIEVNSGGELQMALNAGFTGDQIIFNGTSKTPAEIELAIRYEIYAIQADSLFELELIEKASEKLGLTANVSLRLVPEIESTTHSGLQTALLTSKFGMMPDGAVDAMKRWHPEDKRLNIHGIHIHIGSQNSDPCSYEQALAALFENLLRIKRETGRSLGHINMGGGFPVDYLRDDSHAPFINPKQRELLSAGYEPADVIGAAWKHVREVAAKAEALELLENIELLIEPGRSIIADAGVCLTTVRNRKERPLQSSKFQVPGSKLEASSKSEDSSKFQVSSSKPEDSSKFHFPSFKSEDRSTPENSSGTDLEPGTSKIELGTWNLELETWLLTDAGFNILLSMETYKWYYHLIHATRADEPHKTPYKVAGPLCDGGDVYFDHEGHNRLPDHRFLPDNIQPGEILALLNTGAYTVSQMFPYNGRELPSVLIK
ncbi:MAG: hypothetical protein HKN33_11480 [Pyrinomonadaceae bacterium]|nr:hypothetical protein [Pyrinomonadaceae bacterium]